MSEYDIMITVDHSYYLQNWFTFFFWWYDS